MKMRRLVLISLLFETVASGAPKPRIPLPGAGGPRQFSIQVNVAENANGNSPIPVDFVAVTDKKLLQELAKFSAKDWFDRRAQLSRDFPGKVQIVSWEWVPGQHSGLIGIDIAKNARAAFLFANYNNNGDHRAVVSVRTPAIVSLGPDEFSVQALR